MPPRRFCFLAATLFCSISRACTEPLVIPLPPHTISTPPAASALGSPVIGSWHDGLCLLLPPGVTPFEAVSDTLTFRADGTFTQTVEKATGRVPSRGTYTVTGSRLTLFYLFGPPKPVQYEFSRAGDRLRLQPVGLSRSAAWTLSRTAAPALERPSL